MLQNDVIQFCGIYACPHNPIQNVTTKFSCGCRKPNSGLIKDLIRDFQLDSERTVMVGNAETDVEAANTESVVGLLVKEEEDWQKVITSVKELLC